MNSVYDDWRRISSSPRSLADVPGRAKLRRVDVADHAGPVDQVGDPAGITRAFSGRRRRPGASRRR